MLITMRIDEMKQRYRVFRRGWGIYYCEDLVTKKQESLRTRDKDEAFRLVSMTNRSSVPSMSATSSVEKSSGLGCSALSCS